MPLQKKFNHEIIWTPALTGACAIDAVGVPYTQTKHTKFVWQLTLFFLEPLTPKFDNDPKATVRPEQGLLLMRKN
jgi:3-isopropylmalate dehydrogenase